MRQNLKTVASARRLDRPPRWPGKEIDMTRRFLDKRSDAYNNAVDVMKGLLLSDGHDSTTRAYSEAIWESELEIYQFRRKVTPRKGPHVCTQRLAGKRACVDTQWKPCPSPRNIPGMDHGREWVKDGKTFSITFEPYGMTHETLRELLDFADKNNFSVELDAGSWHFPHRTLLVELTRKS